MSSALGLLRADSSEKQAKKKRRKSSSKALVGTSTALEKPYLRLTDFPKPENVRPLPVLRKVLAHIKNKYIQEEDFEWANEQLKSARQDLTVQHIRNDFVLEVYETHARILLEHGDLNEFHQCQTMLRSLTAPNRMIDINKVGSSKSGFASFSEDAPKESLKQNDEQADEFYAYGLLYNLIQNTWGEMNLMLSTSKNSLKKNVDKSSKKKARKKCQSNGSVPECLRGHAVKHALSVVSAIMHDDYQSFFRLYEAAPNLSAYLMDFLVQRVRKSAYVRTITAYRPTLSVEHFREALFFQDLEETRRFLKSQGCIFIHELGAPPFWVDCKATFLATAKVPVGRIR